MTDELRRIAKAAIINTVVNEGIPGLLGRADGTLYFTDAASVIQKDRVWCRIGEGDSPTEVVVYCVGVPRQYDLPVIVANRNGRPTAIRADNTRASVFSGGRQIDVTEHAWTHGRFGNDPLYITGPAILPLMAVPSDPPALTVQVREGFYRYQGVEKVFTTQTSSSLSAHVPSSALQQKFVVLSINRSTNALTVTAGTTVSAPASEVIPFTASEVLAIVDDLTDVHMPIAAIRFYNGQTRITANDIFMDLRLWGGEYVHSVPSTGDDHTQYFLLAGRAGGQTGYGSTASGENLTLASTSHATKGKIIFGAVVAVDEANGRLGVGTTSPATKANLVGSNATLRFGTAAEADSSTFQIDVATSGGSTNSGNGRDLVVIAGASDNTAGKTGGDLYIRPGAPVAPATAYGDVILADQGGNVGIGITSPAVKLDIDPGSNSSALRIRGTAETTEIADLYVGSNGELIISLTAGADAAQFIDLRSESSSFGVIIRESDGTGTDAYANLHVTDSSPDYVSIVVTATASTNALNITSSDQVGIGILPQGKIHGHDGTGGWIFSTKTGVAGTAVNVIANGTGDTTARLFAMYSVKSSGGLVGQGTVTSGVSVSNDLFNNGTEIFRIIGNADGSIDVQRTAGTHTWTVALWAIWL